MSAKRYWLMKSEPEVFSFEDLLSAPKQTTHWEGVRNYQARNFMRDDFKVGDEVLYYHSNAEPPGIAGIAKICREAYPDPSAEDPKSEYYDEATRKRPNVWVMVDVRAVRPFARYVTRELLTKDKATAKMLVLQKGSRLSIQPVTESEFLAVCQLGDTLAG